MAKTTIITNKQSIPYLVVDDEQRTLSFEYGESLVEFVYHIPSDSISMPAFLGSIQNAVDNGDFKPIVQGYIADGTLLPDPDNELEITDPMWLAVM